MKKGIKIALLTLAGLIVGGGAVILAFGGRPFVRQAGEDFQNTDSVTATPYPYGDRAVPDDYIPVTFGGWTVSAPVQLESVYKEGDNELRKRVYTADYGTDGRLGLFFVEPYAFGALDLTGQLEDKKVSSGIADFVMKSYAKKLGYQLTDWYTLFDLVYHLTSADAGSSLRNGLGYYLFAYLKEETVSHPAWEFHTKTADGFIQINYAAEDSPSQTPYGVIAELFPKNDRNTAHDLILKASDEETLINMINSLQFDPTKAEGAGS